MKHILYIALIISTILSIQACSPVQKTTTEVLIIGGSTSGISAGLQSARLQVSTLIVEETPWLGGMISAAGVSAIDGNHNMPSGIWAEFRDKIYKRYGGPNAVATGWVSNTLFEPHVADSIFKAMASAEKQLTVLHGYRLTEIIKQGDKVVGAKFDGGPKGKLTVEAKIVVDATDLGDGLALAGAAYDLGMEARSVTGEDIAPETANNIIQDLTWVATLKDYGEGADKTINKPSNYNPEIYRGSCTMTVDSIIIDCDKMLSYGRLPNNKFMINWPRYGNDIYLNVVEMSWEERQKELKKAKEKTLGFVYYIQTELGYKNIGLADDEFPTEDKLALIPYNREGRRLKGIQRFTINHVQKKEGTLPLYRTGISVGDYPVDHHHAYDSEAPLINFPPIPSFNVPLGTLIPESIDGLIVSDKAISVSNIINGATRLQPCVLLTGQAAGALAATCVKQQINPREVNIRQIQQILLDAGAYIMPLFDVKPHEKEFQAIQRTTAAGILAVKGQPWHWANRTWFNPDTTISVKDFSIGLNTYEKSFPLSGDISKLTLKKAIDMISELQKNDVSEQAKAAWEKTKGQKFDPAAAPSKREIAIIADAVIRPFEAKEIGFDGKDK